MDHNPFLTKRPPGGRGMVERLENIAWQTRAAPPSELENRLADALERIFASGADTLEAVVRGLNEEGLPDPQGRPWTEASFQALMQTLGR